MKSKLLIIGLLFSLGTFAQVPDNETFCLSDVVSQIWVPAGGGGSPTHPSCLNESFTYADGGCFNSYYNGGLSPYPQNSMLRFRNYGCYNPTVTVQAVTNITATTATGNGNVTNTGRPAVTSAGVCWSDQTLSPTLSNSYAVGNATSGAFTASITGLSAGKTYYVRSWADNGRTVVYSGTTVYFDTPAPAFTFTLSTSITGYSNIAASFSCSITVNSGSGSFSEIGFCWNTTGTPTTANSHITGTDNGYGTGFTGYTESLSACTTYHVRSYAIYNGTTYYGDEQDFTTTRPSGLSTLYFIDQFNYVNVTSSNVAYYAANHSGVTGSHEGQGTGYDSSIAYDGTGTDCTVIADGYYVMTDYSGSFYYAVQVTNGVITYL